jgi:(R,R)-butanediol dehydrogenase/meso-butanediol dehydrogenase/diacetyl reductase
VSEPGGSGSPGTVSAPGGSGPGTMRAAVYHGPGDVRITTAPVPRPAPGEVLIKVGAAGICGSDAAEYTRPRLIRTGPEGAPDVVVLGHEFAGRVAAVGAGLPAELLGQLIACGAGVSCGACAMCARGRTNLCLSYHTLGFHRDGGLAGYVTAPAAICVPVGDRPLGADTAALAQPMAIAVHARSRGRVHEGQVVLIVGAGGIGAFLTYACAAAGARVWVADIAADRLALAQALGAEQVISSRVTSPAAALADAGLRAEIIFEVSGSAAGLEAALQAAHPGAVLVAVGIQEAPRPARLAEWTLREYDVLGTVAHVCATDLPAALDLLAMDPAAWAAVAPEVLPLDDLVTGGLEPLGAGRSARVKTLFDPSAAERRTARHGPGDG